MDMGLDSLAAVEFRNRVQAKSEGFVVVFGKLKQGKGATFEEYLAKKALVWLLSAESLCFSSQKSP